MRYAALEGLGLLSQADLEMLARVETAQAKRDLKGLEDATKKTGSTIDKDLGGPVADVEAGLGKMGASSAALAGVLAGVLLVGLNKTVYAVRQAAGAIADFVRDSIALAGSFNTAWTNTLTRFENAWGGFQKQIGDFFVLSPSLNAAISSIASSFEQWTLNLSDSSDKMLPYILLLQEMGLVLVSIGETLVNNARAAAQFWALMPGAAGDIGADSVKALDDIAGGLGRIREALIQAGAAAANAFLSNGGALNFAQYGPDSSLAGGPDKPGKKGPGIGGIGPGSGMGFFGIDPVGFQTAGEAIRASILSVSEVMAPLDSEIVKQQQHLKELRESVVGAAFDFTEFQGPILEITATQYAMADAIQATTNALSQQVGQYLAMAIAGGKAHLSLGKLLATMSSQMFATAIVELGAGIAASSGAWGRAIFGDPSAHFRAAAVFGVAGAALAAASNLAGGPGGTPTGGSGGGGRGNATPTATGTTAAPASMQQNVTIYLDGQGFIQDPTAFAQTLQDSLDRVNKRRGRG